MRQGGERMIRRQRCQLRRSRRRWLSGVAALWLGSATIALAVEPPATLTGHLSVEALHTLRPIPRESGPPREFIDLSDDPPGLDPPDARGRGEIAVFDTVHTEAMEQVARQADAHTRRGFELAGRRAYYSAREEFIQALRMLSQALDVEQGVNAYSTALAAGMRALDEVEDFVPRGASLEAELDVPMVVSAHATPVFHYEPLEGVTPLVARQRYYTYAREQLGVCVGRELAGSMALHGLGKLHAALAVEQQLRRGSTEAEAMVYYQAALLVAPHNHLAANDLGTLMVAKGNLAEARNLFLQSLQSQETAAAWSNLAKAHRHLGEQDLAARAEREAQRLDAAATPQKLARGPSSAVKIDWVRPQAMTAAEHEQFLDNKATASPARVSSAPTPTNEPQPRAAKSWWPWNATNTAK